MQKKTDTAGMDTALLLTSTPAPGVALLTLNRPGARNALSLAMIAALHEAIEALGQDASIGAVVVTGNGTAFSAGHDLKEMTAHRAGPDGGRAFFETTMGACSAMMRAIVACPKPFIAAVNGVATAAGCQLVATCDLAVASRTAVFATPGVDIGLFCSTPMVALSRNISRKRAMEMLLTGNKIGAEQAVLYGLVNRIAEPADVVAEAVELARHIASKSKTTVAIGKEAFYAQAEMPLSDAYAYASKVMVENMLRADAEEGICAFLEKRPPVWKE